MATKCFTDFKEALDAMDDLDDDEKKALLEDVENRAQARLERRMMPRAQALNQSIESIIKEREISAKISQRQSVLSMRKAILADKQISVFKNKTRGLLAFSTGVESNLNKGRFSITALLISDKQAAYASFLKDIEGEKLLKVFNDPKNDADLGRELQGIDTKNPQVKRIAEIMKKSSDDMRQQLNFEGANIGEAEDRIAKMVHNSDKLQSATGNGLSDSSLRGKLLLKHKGDYVASRKEYTDLAYNNWRNFIRPKLDDAKTFENIPKAKEEKFLRGVWEGLVTGIHKVPYTEQGSPFLVRSGSNIAKKLSEGRVLFFKSDGESWVNYNKKYGYGSVHDAFLNEIEQSSKALTTMKKLGTSPKVFMERLIRKYKQEERSVAEKKTNERNIKKVNNFMNELLGNSDRVSEGLLGKTINAMRTFTYLTRVGNMTLASIPDVNVMVSAMRQHNVPAVKVMADAMKNLGSGMGSIARKQLFLDMRVYSKGSIGSVMSRFGNVDSPFYTFSKGLQLTDKLTLINHWDAMNRATMGMNLGQNLANVLGTDFDKLYSGEQRTLNISGIDKNVWKLLQGSRDKLTKVDGINYLTPEIANDLSDDAIKEYSRVANPDRKKMTAEHLQRTRNDIKDRLGVYFTDQTAYGKVLPNASDRSLMNLGVDRNTIPGKIWGLMTMFKSFHVAALRRTYGRFLFGHGAESLYDAIFHGKADFAGMTQYMVQSMPWNYISMASENLAKGMMPPDLSERSTWEGLAARSIVPLYGSFLQAVNGKGIFSGLSPVYGTLGDLKGLVTALAKGKNVANQMTWLAEGNTPVIKTFYTQLALNRFIWDKIHENIDPSYANKTIMRAQKRGQSYWLPPR